jgi:adenylate cyclase
MIEELKHRSLHRYVAPFNLAIIYLGMGDRERALAELEKARAADSPWMTGLKMDRIFDPLRLQPRFIALMKKVNFQK